MRVVSAFAFILCSFFLLNSCSSDPANDAAQKSDSLLVSAVDSISEGESEKGDLVEDVHMEEVQLNYSFKDSVVQTCGDYSIVSIPYNVEDEENNGTEVRVLNTRTGFRYVAYGNVAQPWGEYMLMEDNEGSTTNEQQFFIVRLKDGEHVLNVNYKESYSFKNGMLYFKAVVNQQDITDKSKLPDCSKAFKDNPTNIGYTEEQSFNFKNGELKHTEKFACTFIE